MKKGYVIFILFISIKSFSQCFEALNSTSVNGNVSAGEIIDINKEGEKSFYFLKNDSIFHYDLKANGQISFMEIILPGATTISFADISKNNFLDIAYSGNDGIAFLENKQGVTSSSPSIVKQTILTPLYILDLEKNGKFDFVGLADNRISIFSPEGEFNPVNNGEQILDLKLIDYNNDGNKDLLVTYHNGLMCVYLHDVHKNFTPSDTLGYIQQINSFDFDGSGKNDLLIFDLDKQLYLKLDSSIISLDSLDFSYISQFEMADLNSDGIADLAIGGIRQDKNVLTLLLSEAAEFKIEEMHFGQMLFDKMYLGDIESDGDLDLVITTNNADTTIITLYKNISEKENNGPYLAPGATAFPTLNGVYLFFDSAYDDHTPIASLSYDLLCQKAGEEILISSDFDQDNLSRLINRTGNIGRSKKIYLPDLSPGFYNYKIQGIDNALHSSSTVCQGSFECCYNFSMTELKVCEGEEIMLQADPTTKGRWFSANKRDLVGNENPAFSFKATVSDTIYYASTTSQSCSDYSIWKITIIKSPLEGFVEDMTACFNEDIVFNIENIDSLHWKSLIKNFAGESKTFSYKIDTPVDTLAFEFYYSGCTKMDTIKIIGSKPDVSVRRSKFSIAEGDNVNLEANGAEKYEWHPKAGLSSPFNSHTIARPDISTAYFVVGYDSINCMDTSSVNITVLHSSYIPNLFTPNNDGQNDLLRIIGLKNTSEFDFMIFDRMGKVIFHTQDISEITTRGWDGTLNGSLQPDGVYYWKISGSYNGGQEILLNGKEKGEVVLKR